ncbi:MAG: heavy-metal-associated domain-containing protein [Nanoarchaeota archaeon]|nr:heavy-metal-associated domain-containing protein [Nanoarchaeota archaeon]
METVIKLKVKGMHCPSCEMLIKDILEDEEIKVISISHKTGDIKVSFDKNNVDFDEVKRILAEEGHEVVG